MKTLKILQLAIFLFALSSTSIAQTHEHGNMNMIMDSTKTESFKVFGKCDMCKVRIEKTVISEGATSASWDSKTQILTVAFDPSKTSKDRLSRKLASVGHDTEDYKAPDNVYEKLPGCCHYERSK
jgi:periplasmic mercuric ion binding protein